MGVKRCPKCGNARLLAKKIVGVQVESLDNGEFKVNAEGGKYQIEIVGCAKCKANFDESELVEMIPCKKCGILTDPQNLDANGECDVCQALTERPDLVNMSKEDLIRMMLKLEKNTSTTAPVRTVDTGISSTAEEKMKAAQAAIANTSNDFSQEIAKETEKDLEEVNEMVENVMNPPVEDGSVEIDKPKRKRGPRKKNETEETVTADTAQEDVEQAANEMADLQEAPFPEQDNDIKSMFNEMPVQQENPSIMEETAPSPFQMFDSEQSF